MTTRQTGHVPANSADQSSQRYWMHWLGKFSQFIRRGATGLVDLVIPPMCLGCKLPMLEHHTLCATCWRNITFIGAPYCDRLGLPMPYDTGGVMVSAAAIRHPPIYDRARAVALYDGHMRRLIHDFKFRDTHDARRLFARWLMTAGHDLLVDADLIVPVPLYRLRLLTRRFNQAAMLAQDIGQMANVVTVPFALVRIRRTRQQVGLTVAQRQKNVRGAFVVPKRMRKAIANRNIVLIDDVVTTGATVEACAKALKEAGAARVDVISLARVTSSEVAEC